MGIQKDAEELLVYIYKQKISGVEISLPQELREDNGWNDLRITLALEYLINKHFLNGKIVQTMDGKKHIHLNDITHNGIDIVENEQEFEKQFNHKINLGIYEFSWGAKEK